MLFNTTTIICAILPFIGYSLGWYIDKAETERMTLFRDKSALYGRPRKPNELPSWP